MDYVDYLDSDNVDYVNFKVPVPMEFGLGRPMRISFSMETEVRAKADLLGDSTRPPGGGFWGVVGTP